MTRSRSDWLWGAGLLAVAVVLAVQLLLGDADEGFQVAARVLRLVLTGLFALVASWIMRRWWRHRHPRQSAGEPGEDGTYGG